MARRAGQVILVLNDGKIVVAHAGMKESMQGAAPGRSATSPSTAKRPARPTSSACRSATTGPLNIAAGRWSFTATPPCRTRSGLTRRSTSTPAASLAAPHGVAVSRAGTGLGEGTASLLRAVAAISCPTSRSHRACRRGTAHDDLLDLADVRGKRIVSTRLSHNVTIREENGTAAAWR